MFSKTLKGENFNVIGTGRSVARRQLQTSIGAVVVIAALAVAVTFGARSTASTGEQIAKASSTSPVIVRSAVRVMPSEQMQASVKSDRRS